MSFFFPKDFFDVDHFKVFTEFATILLLFYALIFLAPRQVEILVPGPGIEPAHPALEGEVLTIRPPGKSLPYIFKALSPRPITYWGLGIQRSNLRGHCPARNTMEAQRENTRGPGREQRSDNTGQRAPGVSQEHCDRPAASRPPHRRTRLHPGPAFLPRSRQGMAHMSDGADARVHQREAGTGREAWVALLTSFNPDALRGRSNHSPVGSKPQSLPQPGNFSALGQALRGVLLASESWFCCAWSVSLGKVTSQSF